MQGRVRKVKTGKHAKHRRMCGLTMEIKELFLREGVLRGLSGGHSVQVA
jgi:hypothetical protein